MSKYEVEYINSIGNLDHATVEADFFRPVNDGILFLKNKIGNGASPVLSPEEQIAYFLNPTKIVKQ